MPAATETVTIPGSGTVPSSASPGRHSLRLAAACLIAFVGLVVVLYVASVHAATPNSDGATVVMEGHSIAHGHLTLASWRLSYDSFWSIDALVYALAVLVAGVRPVLLHLVPAVIAAAVVITGARLAFGTRRGVAGAAGAVTVVAIIGLPSHALARFLLLGPLHIGTTLWCLIAFACVARAPSGWRLAVATVVLAAGITGDLQTLAYGVLPMLLAGMISMLRCRSVRAGLDMVSVAIASVVLAVVVRAVALAFGTFSISPTGRASLAQAERNVHRLPGYLARLLGLGSSGFGRGGAPAILDVAHAVGAVVVGVAAILALAHLVLGALLGRQRERTDRGPWRLDDLLVIAIVGDLAVFVGLALSNADVTTARYLTPAVIFGALLGGRAVARFASVPLRAQRCLGVVGIATVAGLVAALGFTVVQPAPTLVQARVGRFLVDHHLTSGVADYWDSTIVTVTTGNHVAVRPVVASSTGRLVAFDRQTDLAWYGRHRFDFVLYNPSAPYGGVDVHSARQTFGSPLRTYRVAGDIVMVWSHPFTVARGTG